MAFLEEFLVSHGPALNSWALLGGFPLIAALEVLSMRRRPSAPLRVRWLNNIGLFVLSQLMVSALLPFRCIELAALVDEKAWGLINRFPGTFWIELLISLLVLDLVHFAYHYAAHRVPLLWRIHRVHHTDPDLDVTTSLRIHPIELLIQVSINLLVILALGLPIAGAVLYEFLSMAISTFNHGNFRLPQWMDRVMRKLIVTPDMHRIHHSNDASEYNSNYGSFLSWWDYIFGTYVAAPKLGHIGMSLGLPGFWSRKHLSVLAMLVNPFLSLPGGKGEIARSGDAISRHRHVAVHD